MWIVEVALRRPYTFLVMALVILLAGSTSGARAAGGVSLEYKGTLLMESPTGFVTPPPHNFGKFKISLSWDAVADTEDGKVVLNAQEARQGKELGVMR